MSAIRSLAFDLSLRSIISGADELGMEYSPPELELRGAGEDGAKRSRRLERAADERAQETAHSSRPLSEEDEEGACANR